MNFRLENCVYVAEKLRSRITSGQCERNRQKLLAVSPLLREKPPLTITSLPTHALPSAYQRRRKGRENLLIL